MFIGTCIKYNKYFSHLNFSTEMYFKIKHDVHGELGIFNTTSAIGGAISKIYGN